MCISDNLKWDVAHGIVRTQALCRSARLSKYEHISVRTTGVVFLGTPHQGSKMASWGFWVARFFSFLGSNAQIVDEIVLDSSRVRDLHADFVAILQNNLRVVNIYETRPYNFGFRYFPWHIMVRTWFCC